MILHIYTGAKGGIGKTLCALSTLSFYLLGRDAGPILALDLNWNNPDFSDSLIEDNGELIAPEWHWFPGVGGIVWAIMRPASVYSLPTEEGHIWARITSALEVSQDRWGREPSVVIVDTALHPANLMPPPGTYLLSELVEKYGLMRLSIWFLWTLAAATPPRSDESLIAVGDAMQNISELVGQNVFPVTHPEEKKALTAADSIAANFYHVVNPVGMLPQQNLIQLFSPWKKDLPAKLFPEMEALAKAQKSAKRLSIRGIADYYTPELPDTQAAESIYDNLAYAIRTEYDGRPANLGVIPSVEGELIGSTERFLDGFNNADVTFKRIKFFANHINNQLLVTPAG